MTLISFFKQTRYVDSTYVPFFFWTFFFILVPVLLLLIMKSSSLCVLPCVEAALPGFRVINYTNIWLLYFYRIRCIIEQMIRSEITGWISIAWERGCWFPPPAFIPACRALCLASTPIVRTCFSFVPFCNAVQAYVLLPIDCTSTTPNFASSKWSIFRVSLGSARNARLYHEVAC